MNSQVLSNYFKMLVNHFFKILPIRENEEGSLQVYIKSLQIELLGCNELVCAIHNDASYLTLISILQYLLDNPSCPVKDVKREVFKAISICNKLSEIYCDEGGDTP